MSFIQGLKAGQNIVDSNRREKQRQLTNNINNAKLDGQGFSQDAEGNYQLNELGQARKQAHTTQANVVKSDAELQLQVLQEKNTMMESILKEQAMTRGVVSLSNGKVEEGLKFIKNNPILWKQLQTKGVNDLKPVDWANDSSLWASNPDINPTPEQLQDPKIVEQLNKAFHKMQTTNGDWKLVSTQNIVNATGTMNYVSDEQRKKMTTNFNKMAEVLNGHILTTEEMRTQQLKEQNTNLKLEGENKVLGMTNDEFTKLVEENPDMTVAEVQRKMMGKQPKDLLEEAKIVKTQAQAQDAINKAKISGDKVADSSTEYTNANVKDFSAKFKTNGFTDEDRRLAVAIGHNKDWDYAKAGATTKSKLNRLIGISKEAVKLKNTVDKITFDTDMIESVKEVASKLMSTDWQDPKAVERAREAIAGKAQIKALFADYINMVSGQGVTDQERQDILNTFNISNWNDADAIRDGVATFADTMKHRAMTQSELLTHPLDMIDYGDKMKDLYKQKDFGLTRSNSNTGTSTSNPSTTGKTQAEIDTALAEFEG